jgi:hypothetical protein
LIAPHPVSYVSPILGVNGPSYGEASIACSSLVEAQQVASMASGIGREMRLEAMDIVIKHERDDLRKQTDSRIFVIFIARAGTTNIEAFFNAVQAKLAAPKMHSAAELGGAGIVG